MSAEQNIHQRLHAAQARVDYVQKEKKAGMRYSIVSHDAVTAKVRPILHDCGVVYYPIGIHHTQHGNRTEVAMCVRFANIDNPEDHIDVPSLGYGIDDQDKGPGKAISYAVKYALLKTLGLETGDDPDIDQDVRHEPERPALGSGKARDEMDVGVSWEAWAKGDKNSDCAKWGASALKEIQAFISSDQATAWTALAFNAHRLNALRQHNGDRYDKIMVALQKREDELRDKEAA
jgi:hypothetical protein